MKNLYIVHATKRNIEVKAKDEVEARKKALYQDIGHIEKIELSDYKKNPRMYPGFRGGAKRPEIEFRYIKVPGGHKPIKDEPGVSTFVKTKYTITFIHNGKKKKQVVWARDQEEAFEMIKDLYPGIKGDLKKNPRTYQNLKLLMDEDKKKFGHQFVKTIINLSDTHLPKELLERLYKIRAKAGDWAIDENTDEKYIIKGKFKQHYDNPRGAGIPIDHIQLDLMVEAHKSGKVFADSTKERKEMDRLVKADLMLVVSKANDVYNLTARGKKLLIEYLKEQEKHS